MTHHHLKKMELTHSDLVERAVRWLRGKGCRLILHEPFRTPLAEQPDAIGWRDGLSILVEAKASRADFLLDHGKPWRMVPGRGMGDWRFFMTPAGLVKPEELPQGWGLLEVGARRVRTVTGGPRGNLWWDGVPFLESNKRQETMLLASALAQPTARPRPPATPRRGIDVEAWAKVPIEQ